MPFLLRNAMRLHFLLMRDRSPIRKGMLRGVRLTMRELSWALAYRDEIVRRINCLLERFDAWLCPVSPTPAFTHRKPGMPVGVDGRKLSYFIATGGYTTPFNLSGHPVVVLPAGWSPAGLPIGVQVVGHRWKDEQLLAIAEQLVEVIGPFQRPPGY